MKVKSSFLLFICAISVAFEGCKFTPSPWDGLWNLNKSKSRCIPPTFSIAVSPSGEYHVDNGRFSYSFRCDGKDDPADAAHMTSCSTISPREIALTEKTTASMTINTHWILSADGKTLITRRGLIQRGGSVKDQEKVFERISGSSGFSGHWREADPLQSLPRTVVLILNYSAFHVEYDDTGQFSDSRDNEPATPIQGLNEPLGFSRSVKILGPRQIQTEDSYAGRVVRRSTWKVSDDGKTMYEESWAPDSPTQKDLLVYERP